jgi:hypothetical protein
MLRTQRNESDRQSSDEGHDDRGATLMLALAYMLVVSAIIGALSYWIANDALNATQFARADAQEIAYANAVGVAEQTMRYNPLLAATQNANPPVNCWGTSPSSLLDSSGLNVSVWCSTKYSANSHTTRIVSYSACLSSVSASSCNANPNLMATVIYDDYLPGATMGNSPCTTTCGAGQTVVRWNWINQS